MPVFDQGYQRLDAPILPPSVRWWPIFREATLPQLKRRMILVLMAMSCGKLTVYSILLALRLRAGHSPMAAMMPTLDSLRVVRFVTGDGYGGQWVWLAALGAVLGGGLIARDVQTGALRLYLSRPLSRFDYCLGKVASLLLFFGVVILGPALLLVGFHAAATGETTHLRLDGPTLPALLAVGLSWVVLGSLIVAALSATLGSPRLAGLAWLGYLLLGDMLATETIAANPGAEWPYYLSMQRVIASLGERMLMDAGVASGFEPAPLAYDAIAVWFVGAIALSCGLLWARLSEVRR